MKSAGTGTLCIFKNLTGVPCPSCGMTRSAEALLHGDISSSLRFHPLLSAAVFSGAVILFRRRTFFSSIYKSKAYWLCTAVMFAAAYIIRMILMFPRTAPMDYSGHNALSALSRFISGIF